nr:retrovirus-related Pol polyprotein from transposon TNT 1-94 [Tanacetum cinerariifolium]
MALTFADTHNMIAYLTKSDASEGFDQIIDFLNTSVIKAQVGDLSFHTTKYPSPAVTQKVFANMRMVGKGFSEVETPLFESMIVAQQVDDVVNEVVAGVDVDDVPAAADVKPSLPSPRPTTQPLLPSQELPSTSQDVAVVEKTAEIEKDADFQGRLKESQAQIYQIDLEHADKVLSMQDDELEPVELKEVVTTAKLMTEVVTAAAATITVATTLITAATITAAPSTARRRKGVVIRDLEETATPSIIIHFEPKSKDKGKRIMVEEPKPLKKQAQIDHDEAYKAVKKQKLDEEVEELKKHLQIVPNDDDDVYTEATPLALKVPVVDYAIYSENNKPFYKIIRADGSHQLFLSFISLLRNFDREDLEVLWQLVKERFASSKPKNFSDDFLLTTLTYMFEKPDVQAQKLYEPLAEAKPTSMKAEDWTLLDRQALGAVRLSLAKNEAYNVVNKKTTYGLYKALSSMYEKVHQIRLISVDIKFDDEVQALVLVSLLLKSWSGTVTAKTKAGAEIKIEGKSRTNVDRNQRRECSKPVASKDKEVHMAVRDYDDALVCCVENTVEDRIMDSDASFHPTFCKEELENFRLHSVKNLRLGRISDKGMKILASKDMIPDLQKAVVGFCEPCVLGKQKKKWKAAVENETNLQVKCLKSDNGGEYISREFIQYCAENGIRMLKTVPKMPQQNGVDERMNRTLNERAKSIRLHVGLPKLFWEDSVITKTYLINRGPSVMAQMRWDIAFRDMKGHKVVRRDVTFNEESLFGDKAATDSSNLTKPNQKDQMVLKESLENLVNKSIVAEHGLSSKITQSPGASLDTSSETLHVRRSTREFRAPVRYFLSANNLLLTKNDEPESHSEALSSKEFVQWKKAVDSQN